MARAEDWTGPVILFPTCDPHGFARDALGLGHAWTRLVSGRDLYQAWTLSLPAGLAPGTAARAVLLAYGQDGAGSDEEVCNRLRRLLEECSTGAPGREMPTRTIHEWA